jgi:Carboxypeptidase regulatory-like domain
MAAPGTAVQNAAGRIIGNVTDPSGASISGATVTVTNAATQNSQQTTTDRDGYYQVLALPIGTYSVAIEKDGFQRQIFERAMRRSGNAGQLHSGQHDLP